MTKNTTDYPTVYPDIKCIEDYLILISFNKPEKDLEEYTQH